MLHHLKKMDLPIAFRVTSYSSSKFLQTIRGSLPGHFVSENQLIVYIVLTLLPVASQVLHMHFLLFPVRLSSYHQNPFPVKLSTTPHRNMQILYWRSQPVLPRYKV